MIRDGDRPRLISVFYNRCVDRGNFAAVVNGQRSGLVHFDRADRAGVVDRQRAGLAHFD